MAAATIQQRREPHISNGVFVSGCWSFTGRFLSSLRFSGQCWVEKTVKTLKHKDEARKVGVFHRGGVGEHSRGTHNSLQRSRSRTPRA